MFEKGSKIFWTTPRVKSYFFPERSIKMSFGSFALYLVHQDASVVELPKTIIGPFLGEPFDLRGGQKLRI